MTRSLKLALLVCDTPMPEVIEKYGEYTEQFPRVFSKAAESLRVTIQWDFFDVVHAQEYPENHLDYDAIVITGSKYNAHDDDAWILKLMTFLRKVRETKQVKIIGVCFGHQVLLRALGGITGRSGNEWEVGRVEIELTPEGKKYFGIDRSFLRINQFHHDAVSKLPADFENLAFTVGNTASHATVSTDRQCITIQGHPEFNRETVKIMIERRKELGILPGPVADKSLEILKNSDFEMDDVWVVEKFIELIIAN